MQCIYSFEPWWDGLCFWCDFGGVDDHKGRKSRNVPHRRENSAKRSLSHVDRAVSCEGDICVDGTCASRLEAWISTRYLQFLLCSFLFKLNVIYYTTNTFITFKLRGALSPVTKKIFRSPNRPPIQAHRDVKTTFKYAPTRRRTWAAPHIYIWICKYLDTRRVECCMLSSFSQKSKNRQNRKSQYFSW